MLVFVLFIACQIPVVTDTEVITGTDTIPRFGSNATVTAVVSGNWSNPNVWDNGVPSEGDTVSIPVGATIQYDIPFLMPHSEPLRIDVVEVEGRLHFQDQTEIWLNELFVLPDGELFIGSADEPIEAIVVFTDTPGPDGHHFKTSTIDPKQYGNGLIVLGTIRVYGEQKTAFERANFNINQGDAFVRMDTPSDWEVGDLIVIPETSQTLLAPPFDEIDETELHSLGGVFPNLIHLTASTQFKHHGISANPFDIQRFPHVANVSRSVVFKSENPNGVRGHFMSTANAVVDINSAAFIGLGRTKAEPLDSTHIVDGEIVSIGSNQIGRYSLHLHQMTGVAAKLSNNVVANGLKWGITVHGSTNNALVDNNVVYNVDGAAIVTESGEEDGTVFKNNLVIKVNGGFQKDDYRGGVTSETNPNGGPQIVNTAADGSAFWLRTTEGTFIDNFVYDSVGFGFNFNGYYRELSDAKQVEKFLGNEVCSSKGGLWFTWSQTRRNVGVHFQRQEFAKFLAWHIEDSGVHAFHDGFITFREVAIVSDPAISTLSEGHPENAARNVTHGFNFGTFPYENFDHILDRVEVSGCKLGFSAPIDGGPSGVVMMDSVLANYINIAYINGSTAEELRVEDLRYLPSEVFVIETFNLLPRLVANVWEEETGLVDEGTLFPLGDADNNGILNLLDIPCFVGSLFTEYNQRADVNMDGAVDLLDIEVFVDFLSSGN